jgi:hypothetical protein
MPVRDRGGLNLLFSYQYPRCKVRFYGVAEVSVLKGAED